MHPNLSWNLQNLYHKVYDDRFSCLLFVDTHNLETVFLPLGKKRDQSSLIKPRHDIYQTQVVWTSLDYEDTLCSYSNSKATANHNIFYFILNEQIIANKNMNLYSGPCEITWDKKTPNLSLPALHI